MDEYEIDERLYWFDTIALDEEGNDVAVDAPERYATVRAVDSDGMVYVEFDDGLEDWIPVQNIPDFFERVTWDGPKS